MAKHPRFFKGQLIQHAFDAGSKPIDFNESNHQTIRGVEGEKLFLICVAINI